MKDLVIMKNKQAVTTSLQVAESFEKKHAEIYIFHHLDYCIIVLENAKLASKYNLIILLFLIFFNLIYKE